MSYLLRLMQETIADWKVRKIEKPRSTILPLEASIGTSTLRLIRRQACKAGGVKNCFVWRDGELDFEPFTNPCTSCKTQGVGLLQLSRDLWGVKTGRGHDQGAQIGAEEVDIADLRGWINGKAPISPRRLRTAIGKAWLNGWVTSAQAMTMLSSVTDYEAAGSVARRILKQLRSPKKPLAGLKTPSEQVEMELHAMNLATETETSHYPVELMALRETLINCSTEGSLLTGLEKTKSEFLHARLE